MIAVQTVLGFEVTDQALDGRSASYLARDRRRDTTHLTGDPDQTCNSTLKPDS